MPALALCLASSFLLYTLIYRSDQDHEFHVLDQTRTYTQRSRFEALHGEPLKVTCVFVGSTQWALSSPPSVLAA